MVEIEIIDKKFIIEKHKKDITNYQRMLRDIANDVNAKPVRTGEEIYEVIRADNEYAKFIPGFSGEEKALSMLVVEVHDKDILPFIKKGINNHLKNCSKLEKVTIYTYF